MVMVLAAVALDLRIIAAFVSEESSEPTLGSPPFASVTARAPLLRAPVVILPTGTYISG